MSKCQTWPRLSHPFCGSTAVHVGTHARSNSTHTQFSRPRTSKRIPARAPSQHVPAHPSACQLVPACPNRRRPNASQHVPAHPSACQHVPADLTYGGPPPVSRLTLSARRLVALGPHGVHVGRSRCTRSRRRYWLISRCFPFQKHSPGAHLQGSPPQWFNV
jgi:hypothetical protein